MIRVSRQPFEPSERWRDNSVHEQERAAAFYAQQPDGRFDFKVFADRELRSLLFETFGEKCCYCESSVGAASDYDLEHYRPKSTVVGFNGKLMRPAYWWLASSWTNLYAACPVCNRNKANRFPVVTESRRARRPEDDLAAEQPLILDPCVIDPGDSPDRYLVFSADGFVASNFSMLLEGPLADRYRERYQDNDPAQVTIDILGLNRDSLVKAREEVADKILAQATSANPPSGLSPSEMREWFVGLADPRDQYQALQRQVLQEWAEQFLLENVAEAVAPEAEELFEQFAKKREFRTKMASEQRQYQHDLSSVSIEDVSDTHLYRSSRIERVTIVNFRCIDHLEFSMHSGTPDRVGWKVLLGENGVGKSSVLQAIAIALMGQRNFAELVAADDLDPSTLLRRGERRGYVEVALGTDLLPRRVEFSEAGGVTFGPGAESGSRTTLLGFGSARWPYRPGGFPSDQGEYIRIRNLFNPFVPLADTSSWLLGLGRGEFAQAEEAMCRLLGLREGSRLRRRRGEEVRVEEPGRPESKWDRLDDLSDGYQAVLAMTGDILALLTRRYPDVETAEGVVLIDEIGAHLHPRWKMNVVSQLRAAFPQVQVLATTHEPLCLRGLGAGEVVVLRQAPEGEDGEIETVTNLPSPEDFRVDQLLTSSFFGLNSAMDPETEALFNEYYLLLARKEPSKKQRDRTEALRHELRDRQHLGSTPRDEIMYEVIDRLLAADRHGVINRPIGELKEEAVRRIAQRWKAHFSQTN